LVVEQYDQHDIKEKEVTNDLTEWLKRHTVISEQTMSNALDIAAILIKHALHAFGTMD
jgi:hypothetical protein